MEELFTIAVSFGKIVHNRGFSPVLEHAVFCQFSDEVFFYSICYMITTTLKQKSLLDLIYIFTRAYWYWYISLSSTISRSFFYIVAFSLITCAPRRRLAFVSL